MEYGTYKNNHTFVKEITSANIRTRHHTAPSILIADFVRDIKKTLVFY